jgi:hypothetical protein
VEIGEGIMARILPIFTGRKTGIVKFKQISPGPFSEQSLRQEVRNALNRTLTTARRHFHNTTATWREKVDWVEHISVASGIAYFEITTDNALYYLVDHGAKAHAITATNFPTLVWKRDYYPKSEPGILASSTGFRGGPNRRETYIWHKGFKPRDFDETVSEEIDEIFGPEMQKALDNFAKKSGHSM